jgi:serine/threonine protein kinase
MALRTILDLLEQSLDALSYAHSQGIIHCDIKPENFILFSGDYLRLADFGIAKVALRTVEASGSGTLGYIAPEQAMGKPSFKSDVFSLGLILYRMLSGHLPEWPFHWPPPGFERIRRRLHPSLIAFVQRAIEVDPARRFRDASHMLAQFERIKRRTLAYATTQRRKKKSSRTAKDWKEVRRRQFQRAFGRTLETRFNCRRCGGPVSESMRHCPWCGTQRKIHREDTRLPAQCPRCNRGVKLDWKYCPWCYGPGFKDVSDREYTDKRYEARCTNKSCSRKVLMPFMRYCPWCRRAVQRKWKVPGSSEACPSCKWGVLTAYWSTCPWCGKTLKKR